MLVMSVSYGRKSTKKQAAVAAGQSRIRIMTLSGCRGRFQMQGFDLKVLGLEFRPMIFRNINCINTLLCNKSGNKSY